MGHVVPILLIQRRKVLRLKVVSERLIEDEQNVPADLSLSSAGRRLVRCAAQFTLSGASSHGAEWVGLFRVGDDGDQSNGEVLHVDSRGTQAATGSREKL
jgi:hypothetical protein